MLPDLAKRRGRVKSATRVFRSTSSLIIHVLSTQSESCENVSHSLVPTGGGSLPVMQVLRIVFIAAHYIKF